jgi:hypothetical protein
MSSERGRAQSELCLGLFQSSYRALSELCLFQRSRAHIGLPHSDGLGMHIMCERRREKEKERERARERDGQSVPSLWERRRENERESRREHP